MANYSFFLGQGGGSGGGSGGFAIIKIEYPAGLEIQVTFDGDTTDAPDTSGVWIYGCEKTGTYTVKIKNTTVSKTVSITTQGQIETIWISTQVINYALIYYLGNEFAEPSDVEKRYAIKTGGWNVATLSGSDQKIITANNIQTPENCKQFWFTGAGYDYGTNRVKYIISSNTITRDISSTSKGTAFVLGGSTFTANAVVQVYRDTSTGTYMTIYKDSDKIRCTSYGTTISAILSNATSLFNDVTALNWMVLNCTGDFMISALSNANFKNAMDVSPNKSILVANEHWNRFIALLSL